MRNIARQIYDAIIAGLVASLIGDTINQISKRECMAFIIGILVGILGAGLS